MRAGNAIAEDIMVKVHADASNFVSNVSKQEAYTQVLEQARGLFYEQRNWVSLVLLFVCSSYRYSFLHIIVIPRLPP